MIPQLPPPMSRTLKQDLTVGPADSPVSETEPTPTLEALQRVLEHAAIDAERATSDQKYICDAGDATVLRWLSSSLPEMRQNAERWQWFRQFLSVEDDTVERGQFLFMNDDRIPDVTLLAGFEHTVEELADARIAASRVPLSERTTE